MRVKIVSGTDYAELETKLNDYLSTIDHSDAKINYQLDKMVIIVEHEEKQVVCRCCDCQYYDKGGDYRGAWGLCQKKGVRTRFSEIKCDYFTDVRI